MAGNRYNSSCIQQYRLHIHNVGLRGEAGAGLCRCWLCSRNAGQIAGIRSRGGSTTKHYLLYRNKRDLNCRLTRRYIHVRTTWTHFSETPHRVDLYMMNTLANILSHTYVYTIQHSFYFPVNFVLCTTAGVHHASELESGRVPDMDRSHQYRPGGRALDKHKARETVF